MHSRALYYINGTPPSLYNTINWYHIATNTTLWEDIDALVNSCYNYRENISGYSG